MQLATAAARFGRDDSMMTIMDDSQNESRRMKQTANAFMNVFRSAGLA